MTYFLGSLKSAIGRQFADNVPHLAPFRLPSYHKTLQSDQQSPVFEDLLASSYQSTSSGYLSEEDVDPMFNPESSLTTTTTTTAAPTKAAILDLPTDILYVVSDHLDAASTWSLALTCRDLYCIGLPKTQRKLKAPEKKALLTLLERDPFSKGHYYCHKCTKLHRFDPECGPIGEDEPNCSANTCVQRDVFAPTGNTFGFSYHHARLVMNRHLYGPGFGIPIENICVSHEAQRGNVTVACSTKAKIIHDELFMQRTYTFTVPNGAASDFRKCSGHRDFRLCEHLPLLRCSSVYQQGIPELQARPIDGASAAAAAITATSTNTTTTTVTAEDQFLACEQAPGSCGLCLLDYDISIERAAGNGNAPASNSASAAASDSPGATTATATECEWQVTINAYHQLGDCRSPDDWKWARFTEKTRPHLFLPNRPNRRGSGYSPGAVKRMWEHGEERRLLPVTVHLKRHSI